MYSEMRETVCASEKLMLYTDLSYFDFILEILSSGSSFHKSMALHYAFFFAPRSDGVNAADGAQCPALAFAGGHRAQRSPFMLALPQAAALHARFSHQQQTKAKWSVKQVQDQELDAPASCPGYSSSSGSSWPTWPFSPVPLEEVSHL